MKTSRITVAAFATSALLLAGCSGGANADDPETSGADSTGGSDAESGSDAGSDELETSELSYAIFSSGIPSKHVLAADEMGYFDEAGLEVEIVNAGNPGDIIPLMASGQVQFAYMGYETGIHAVNAGVDLVLLREMQRNVDEGQQLWASPQSGIESVADLEGASVAVAGVGGLGDLLLAETLATEDMTLEDVRLVEMPPPSTIPAVASGDVDAAWLPGPFAAAMLAAPEPPLQFIVDFNDIPALEEVSVGALWASREWVEQHPNATEAFVETVDRTAEEFAADPELDREHMARIVPEMEPAVIERHALYPYTGEVPVEKIEEHQERLLQYGVIDEKVDLDAVVYQLD